MQLRVSWAGFARAACKGCSTVLKTCRLISRCDGGRSALHLHFRPRVLLLAGSLMDILYCIVDNVSSQWLLFGNTGIQRRCPQSRI